MHQEKTLNAAMTYMRRGCGPTTTALSAAALIRHRTMWYRTYINNPQLAVSASARAGN
jgi:hypothetical protein